MVSSPDLKILTGATSDGVMPRVVVVVAHPDDETLWAGGLILSNPGCDWFVLSLCRRDDADRAPRFVRVLQSIHAKGTMGDLDDGPQQDPLDEGLVEQAVLTGLPGRTFDLILTHGAKGEYTFHRRHVETSRAVTRLWQRGEIQSPRLWQFAYQDQGRHSMPRAMPTADLVFTLPDDIWQAKYRLVTETYGFDPQSWEARATPREEAFMTLPSEQKGEDRP